MRFTEEALASWLEEQLIGPPPPVLRVDREAGDILAETPGVLVHASSVDVDRRSNRDPGCFRFTLDERVTGEFLDMPPIEQLRRAGARLLGAWSSPSRSLVLQTEGPAGAASDAPGDAVPPRDIPLVHFEHRPPVGVLGAGGRVALFREYGEMRGRVALRPLQTDVAQVIEAPWRSAGEVIEALRPFFDAAAELDAQLGYFEGSWLERQGSLRAIFVFLVTATDDRAVYRTELLAPATSVDPGLVDDSLAGAPML